MNDMTHFFKRFFWSSETEKLRKEVEEWKHAYAVLKAEYDMMDAILCNLNSTRGVLL
jgi:hypothetical protein